MFRSRALGGRHRPIPAVALWLCLLGAELATLCTAGPAHAQEEGPWRLAEALDLPDWLRVRGETRWRYETQDGQFRADGVGDDQLLVGRSLLLLEADTGPVALGIEFQDSRSYLGDDATPLSRGLINPFDVLQLYARVDVTPLIDHLPDTLLGSFAAEGTRASLTLGRQTIDIGARRMVARFGFANVIRGFTGAYLRADNPHGDEFHAFLVAPVARLPSDRARLADNAFVFDEEEWGRRFFALHYLGKDAAPELVSDLQVEAFLYGFFEEDTDDVATPNRRIVWPGFRLFRKGKKSQWDFDIEASIRLGTRRASSDPSDERDLVVRATRLFAILGYTFDAPWQPRLAAEYFWASGDDDPDDGRAGQYERLFAARRGDFNNTGIHGPLTPDNLSAPGFRFSVKPAKRLDARLIYSAAFLAAPSGRFAVARLQDPSGESGDFMGHHFDGRARYWLVPGSLRWELGGSAFFFGNFIRSAPRAPEGARSLFIYSQLTWQF